MREPRTESTGLLPKAPLNRAQRNGDWKLFVNADVETPVIPRDYITEGRAQAPWVQDSQVEQG